CWRSPARQSNRLRDRRFAERETLERQVFHHGCRRLRFVERVEMQPWRACAQQFLALRGGVVDAELRHPFIVIAALLEFLDERRRQPGAAQRDEAFDLGSAEDWQDA